MWSKATAGLWCVDVNLMGLFGRSPCKTDFARPTYKMMSLLVGKYMEEVLSVSRVIRVLDLLCIGAATKPTFWVLGVGQSLSNEFSDTQLSLQN